MFIRQLPNRTHAHLNPPEKKPLREPLLPKPLCELEDEDELLRYELEDERLLWYEEPPL